MFDGTERQILAQTLRADRITSREDIAMGWCSATNRSYEDYRGLFPLLPAYIQALKSQIGNIRGLDLGCGTGRAAAEIMQAHPNIDFRGISLVRYPPVPGNLALPKERVKICHAGHTGFPEESFDLILAFRSLEVSHTIVEGGKGALKLLAPKGVFIFLAHIWEEFGEKEVYTLQELAKDQGFKVKYSYIEAHDHHYYDSFAFYRDFDPALVTKNSPEE